MLTLHVTCGGGASFLAGPRGGSAATNCREGRGGGKDALHRRPSERRAGAPARAAPPQPALLLSVHMLGLRGAELERRRACWRVGRWCQTRMRSQGGLAAPDPQGTRGPLPRAQLGVRITLPVVLLPCGCLYHHTGADAALPRCRDPTGRVGMSSRWAWRPQHTCTP